MAGDAGIQGFVKGEIGRGDFFQDSKAGLPKGGGVLDSARQKEDGNPAPAVPQHAVGHFSGKGLVVGAALAGDDDVGPQDGLIETGKAQDPVYAPHEGSSECSGKGTAQPAGSSNAGNRVQPAARANQPAGSSSARQRPGADIRTG